MRKELSEILKKIEDSGQEAYLVGGYPRDWLLGRECFDYDICTSASPEALKALFSEILEENFGCLKVRYQGISVEITTYRIEKNYVSVRTPVISYTNSLWKDLQRRDFTINTICMDKDGSITDLLSGIEDLKAGIIRTVGDPFSKMKEDPLRMLRAIRFATTLHFSLEDELKKVIIENRKLVGNLSYYRKKEELTKIFLSDNVKEGLSLLIECGVDRVLGFDASSLRIVPSGEGMWAQIEDYQKYPFSKKEKEKVELLQSLLKEKEISDSHLYHYGLEVCQLVLQIKGENATFLIDRYQRLPIKKREDIAISTKELLSFTPEVSNLYTLLEKEILEGHLKNRREELLSFLEAYFKSSCVE